MALRRCIPVLTTTQAKECQSSKYYRTKEKTSLPIVVPILLKSLNNTVVTALIPLVVRCCWSLSVVVGFTSWTSLVVVRHHGYAHIVVVVVRSGHCCRIVVVVFMLWWSIVFAKFAGHLSLLVIVHCGQLRIRVVPRDGRASWLWSHHDCCV